MWPILFAGPKNCPLVLMYKITNTSFAHVVFRLCVVTLHSVQPISYDIGVQQIQVAEVPNIITKVTCGLYSHFLVIIGCAKYGFNIIDPLK